MVVVIHFPPCGTANRCTAPLSFPLPLLCSPIAIMLPSAFTAADDPNLLPAAPSDAVSWAAVDVAVVTVAHPVAGFVNTYAAPFPALPPTPPAPSTPTTTVPPSPLIATSSPKSSGPTGFALVSFARPNDDDHAVPGLVNTYAPSVVAALVPATTVSPFSLTDTRHPKNSLAVRVAAGVSSTALPVSADAHPVFGFVNTYTAPELPMLLLASLSGVPMTTVFPSPLTATASPNRSCVTRSAVAILNFAPPLNVPLPHPPDGFVNTYAAPTAVTIEVASSNGAPTTIVLPSLLTDTAHPKRSPAAVSNPTSLLRVGVVPLPHPPDGLANTYTAPALGIPRSLSWGAETTIVLWSALTAVENPNPSS